MTNINKPTDSAQPNMVYIVVPVSYWAAQREKYLSRGFKNLYLRFNRLGTYVAVKQDFSFFSEEDLNQGISYMSHAEFKQFRMDNYPEWDSEMQASQEDVVSAYTAAVNQGQEYTGIPNPKNPNEIYDL